jgi:hypothetical protein
MEMGDGNGDGWVGAGTIVAIVGGCGLHANRCLQINRLLV